MGSMCFLRRPNMRSGTAGRPLPPGQHPVDGFPRFGTHFHRPAPAIPIDPVIEVSGAVAESVALPLAELKTLPRREVTADFHCVAGWSATDLHWEGVAFETFYRMIIEPSAQPDPSVTHIVFGGLDGYQSVALIEDAVADDVLMADRLDGRLLESDHGAPARLVSPNQYGFVSTKHLCRIELHTGEPTEGYHPSSIVDAGLRLVKPHPRDRRRAPARAKTGVARRLARRATTEEGLVGTVKALEGTVLGERVHRPEPLVLLARLGQLARLLAVANRDAVIAPHPPALLERGVVDVAQQPDLALELRGLGGRRVQAVAVGPLEPVAHCAPVFVGNPIHLTAAYEDGRANGRGPRAHQASPRQNGSENVNAVACCPYIRSISM
jgi:DMSO/TMAO reductase YedYZ molybdopterin-dependent catalytic subunit